jgi:hypothetical protein
MRVTVAPNRPPRRKASIETVERNVADSRRKSGRYRAKDPCSATFVQFPMVSDKRAGGVVGLSLGIVCLADWCRSKPASA